MLDQTGATRIVRSFFDQPHHLVHHPQTPNFPTPAKPAILRAGRAPPALSHRRSAPLHEPRLPARLCCVLGYAKQKRKGALRVCFINLRFMQLRCAALLLAPPPLLSNQQRTLDRADAAMAR